MSNVAPGNSLITEFTDEQRSALAAKFSTAEPFPHLVIDNFLSEYGRQALRSYPSPEWPHWRLFLDEYQKEKRTCDDISKIPEPLSTLIRECSEPKFLQVLQAMTGVDQLLPDPYLGGGGLHCSGGGGVLAPHTDFHYYKRLGLYRMFNLLIYLNEDWKPEDGGRLELYKKGAATPEVEVVPTFARAVLFRTDDKSVHGFANPVAPRKWRKSVALYYYTSREHGGFSGDTTTHWQMHGPKLKGLRLKTFDALIFTSRVFSKLAHMVNPNYR